MLQVRKSHLESCLESLLASCERTHTTCSSAPCAKQTRDGLRPLLQKTPCPPVGPLQLQLFDVPCCDSLVDLLAALEAGGGIEVLQEVE